MCEAHAAIEPRSLSLYHRPPCSRRKRRILPTTCAAGCPRSADGRRRRPPGHAGWLGHRRAAPAGAHAPNTRRFPTRSTSGCARCSRAAASTSCTRTRRPAIEHALGRPQRGHYHADRVRQDALLQRAGPERHPARLLDARAVSVPNKGARAGSAGGAARAVRSAVARGPSTEIGVFTYDGDTPQDARRAIRGRAHVVLSNPDMIHSGILPHHPRWAKLFENLRFVVIDELHAYRGVFGSHLTNVLRGSRRICQHYGSNPVFICSSATIANPRELAEALVEQPFELVSESGAPRGEKFFLFVNPPVVNQQLGIRRSYLAETRRVAAEFLKRQLQVIVFAQSRLATEILTTYLKDDFDGPPGTREQIRGYRGGYLPQRRREIEKGLREGSVRAVVSTNALELGIDIGALDVCVMAGYPGTIAATWQRAGRAGRRSGRSAAVLVGQQRAARPVRRPEPVVFLRRTARARADQPRQPAHPRRPREVRRLRAAVHARRRQYGRHDVQEVLGILAESGFVHRADGRGWRGAVAVDERVLSGRRRQPAVHFVGQLRRRRHDTTAPTSSARRASTAALRRSTRRRFTSSKACCTRSSGSISRGARPTCAGSTATTTPTRSPTRR